MISLTRFDDSKNVNYQGYIEGDNNNTDSASVQMRYEVEYLVPGAQLYHIINFCSDKEIELGVFVAALEEFSCSPVLGGNGGRGFGLCEADFIADGEFFAKIENGKIQLCDKAKNALHEYNQFISDHTEEIIKFMGAVKR